MVQFQMYLQLPKELLLIEVLESNRSNQYVFTLKGKKFLSSLGEICDEELRLFLSPGFNDRDEKITFEEYMAVVKNLL